jgi:hypothetical protein
MLKASAKSRHLREPWNYFESLLKNLLARAFAALLRLGRHPIPLFSLAQGKSSH